MDSETAEVAQDYSGSYTDFLFLLLLSRRIFNCVIEARS